MSVRSAKPDLSASAQEAYNEFETYLTDALDLRPATIRNYLSDLQQFMAWFEQHHQQRFSIDGIATPTLTTYRHYLKHDLQRKPATINRYLVSLKRYFSSHLKQQIHRNPAQAVKLVKETTATLKHMTDTDENQLMASVERGSNQRNITLITLILHTRLRVSEVCNLSWEHVVLQPRSGYLKIWGKRRKYREVPLNRTARQALYDGSTLKQAIERDELIVSVEAQASDAYAVASNVNSLRGLIAVKDSQGIALALTEAEIRQAQIMLGRKGIWAEMSAAMPLRVL